MQRTTSPANVASLPAYASGGETPGYYTDLTSGGAAGTLVSAADMNLIQEEIANAIEDVGGLTLSSASNTQLATTISPVQALKSSATTTGSATTTHIRALVAASASTASGSNSAVVGSASSDATGTDSVVIGSDHAIASGARSAVVGSEFSEASGDDSAVVASDGSYASGGRSAVICGQNVEVGTAGMVGGGTNLAATITANGTDQGLTWSITKTGEVACQALDVNNGVALGGGAAPTLGTIGGTGPTAAAQSKWLEIKIGGTSHWIPVWI